MYFAENPKIAEEYKRVLSKPENPGRMYEVNIHANPEHLLDWTAPIAEQSEHVRNALQGLGFKTKPTGDWSAKEMSRGPGQFDNSWRVTDPYGNIHSTSGVRSAEDAISNIRWDSQKYQQSGAQAYDALRVPRVSGGNDVVASTALREAGIPGMKYLDQFSRVGHEVKPSSNYVLFRDDIIDILKKYGLAGPAVMAAYGMSEKE